MSEAEVPKHIGYILDGNRRWAKSLGLKVFRGHQKGQEALREILRATFGAGVKYVTVYAFSTENWSRPKEEVDYLMSQIVEALTENVDDFLRDGVRVRVLGRRDNLPPEVAAAIEGAERATESCDKYTFGICLNYGGQAELVDAARAIVRSGVEEGEISEDLIAKNLYAPEIPPCDLVVRTSGEKRLSNFMLWRASYSELIFIDKNWPEMTKEDVAAILEEYKRRSRRFGG